MDFDPITFNLQASFISWLQLVGALLAIGLGVGFLLSFSNNGAKGPQAFVGGVTSFFGELISLSPKRILALMSLTLKEATRRKALLVFVVFAVLLMFGGWFLTDSNERPELQFGVHVTFMLTVISWLILPIAIFLSCWGIPEDIRIRSLHTVVTKPARRMEVVIGRILGYSTMCGIVLVLMGVVGYIWIQRQLPATVTTDTGERSLMTCRVPVYGNLFFLDRQALPKEAGLNVGDSWLYRSFVEGNSASRAVWYFRGVTADAVGDELTVESRFEAFRTVKGSKNSVQKGVEAQYTLVNDIRAEAFSSLGIGATFRPIADAFKDASFVLAADRLDSASENLTTAPDSFPVTDCKMLALACIRQVVPTLESMGEDFTDVAAGFKTMGEAAQKISEADPESYQNLSKACKDLSTIVRDRAEDLLASMPRIEVPLDSFAVSEYHEGDNVESIPRKLSYAGSNEAAARFIASVLSRLNDEASLVDGSEISADLTATLQQDDIGIAESNAGLIQKLLEEDLAADALKIEGGKLVVADGRRLLTYIDQLVREERLLSLDAAGWVLTADLFDDLAPNGVLRMEVSCLNDQMYLGMARPDLFIRLKDRPFWVGYTKALLTIGLMLSLVVVVGVTASCMVKGPVCFFLTLTLFIVGQYFHPFIQELKASQQGTGMIESAILMVQHRNPSTGADISESRMQMVSVVDNSLTTFLSAVSNIVPDFSVFSASATYIENGFDVPWASSVLPSLATFFGFLLPCILIGAACLKFRELEAK
ncbi:MAG: hypothetical protein ABJZ55_13880 [Fuerstiella sp.]